MSLLGFANYRLAIPAGQEQALNSRGTRVRCLTASGPFRLGLNSEATFPFEAGMGVSLPAGQEFDTVRLVNQSGAAITVEIVVSFGDFQDDRSIFAGTMNAALVAPVDVASLPPVALAPAQSVNIGTMPRTLSPGLFLTYPDMDIGTAPTQLIFNTTDVWSMSVRNLGFQNIRIGRNDVIGPNSGLRLYPGEMVNITTCSSLYACAEAGTSKVCRVRLM